MRTSAEDFQHSRTAWAKLKRLWAEADGDTRIDLVGHFGGGALMAIAIIGAFGWWGVLFLFGALLWRSFR
jgi:hypothetical protein